MDIAYFLSFYFYIKQGELNLQKRCNKLENEKQILEIAACLVVPKLVWALEGFQDLERLYRILR